MSSLHYNEVWLQCYQECAELAKRDVKRLNQETKSENVSILACPYENNAKMVQQSETYEFYLRYICLANRLEDVYEKLVQPQKRLLVRRLLESCLGRVIELKHDLVNIDLDEFSYNEAVIDRLHLTPLDTEIRIPRYFLRDRHSEMERRKELMNEILSRLGCVDENSSRENLTDIEAIRLVQIHERARQGRLRALFMKEIRMLKKGDKSSEGRGAKQNDFVTLAAVTIQRMWRGYVSRDKIHGCKIEEMILLGMISPTTHMQCGRKKEELDKIFTEQYQMQSTCKERFAAEMQTIYNDVKLQYGNTIMEGLADRIRTSLKNYYEKTGTLPEDFQIFFDGAGDESEICQSKTLPMKETRKTKGNAKFAERSNELKVNSRQATAENFRAIQSMFLPDIKAQIEQFNKVCNKNTEIAGLNTIAYDILYMQQYREIEQELRRTVYNLMKQEIELLQVALGKKAKRNKKPHRFGKRTKRNRDKDLTPDHTTEELYEELVSSRLIRKYPEIRLNKYLGDKALTNRNGLRPSSGDIRQILTEYCILPLGCESIRNSCPLIRSILLAGPKGSGKRSLVYAICTEVGAVLFDLTPANIVGKYPGKTGLIMMIHLVLKVSRLMQPAVIYMGDAELPFMKRIPKSDRNEAKRLKRDLPKLIKNIESEDRVIFIGTTSKPWDADQKWLQQTYDRFIYIPRTDYGALFIAWKTFLSEHSTTMTDLDYSVMAKISDGYTIGAVRTCIDEVLTRERILQLPSKPLTHAELLNVLSLRNPVYREEEEAFETWWSKTPLGRRRQQLLELKEEDKNIE